MFKKAVLMSVFNSLSLSLMVTAFPVIILRKFMLIVSRNYAQFSLFLTEIRAHIRDRILSFSSIVTTESRVRQCRAVMKILSRAIRFWQ